MVRTFLNVLGLCFAMGTFAEAGIPTSNNAMAKNAVNILTPLLFGSDLRCAVFGHPSDFESQHFDNRQVVLFHTGKDGNKTMSRWASLLRTETFCAVGLVRAVLKDTHPLSHMVELLQDVRYSQVVASGLERPPKELLKRHRRRLYWVEASSKEYVSVNKFCPTVGRTRSDSLSRVGLCNMTSCFFVKDSFKCPSPLMSQKMRVPTWGDLPGTIRQALFNKPMAGYGTRIQQALGRMFNYTPEFVFFKSGVYNPVTKKVSYDSNELIKDDVFDFELGGQVHGYDLTPIFIQGGMAFMTKSPSEVLSFGNVTRPFSMTIWMAIVLTLFIICSYIHVAYSVYSNFDPTNVLPEDSKINFFLFGFCKFTEPEPLPWFKQASGGKLSVTLWTIFALFMLMFYQSNLRAYMVTVDYEKPLNTMQDVLDSGKKIWLPNIGMGTKYFEMMGRKGGIHWRVADKAERSNTVFVVQVNNSQGFGLLTREVGEDVINGRGLAPQVLGTRPYKYKTNPLFHPNKIQETKELIVEYFASGILKKHSPALDDASRAMLMIYESGIVEKYKVEYLPGTALLKPVVPKVALKPLKLVQFLTSFFFYAGGMLTAAAVFLFKDRARCYGGR